MGRADAFVDVADTRDVTSAPPFRRVRVAGRRLILLRTPDGVVRAVDADCPHLGGSLVKATLRDVRLRCPRHGHTYDLTLAGRCVDPGDPLDFPLQMHEVRERDGRVEVRPVPERAPSSAQ